MNRYINILPGLMLLAFVVCLAQERIDSGRWKGFLQEQPPLNYVELPTFKVPTIRGTVYYGEHKALAGAAFEFRNKQGNVVSTITDITGSFKVPNVAPGTYQFKVTLNQFHSAIGTIVVSPKFPQKNAVDIQLEIGT